MENGYSWYIAVIFTFGETAGSGLVALPSAMQSLGKLCKCDPWNVFFFRIYGWYNYFNSYVLDHLLHCYTFRQQLDYHEDKVGNFWNIHFDCVTYFRWSEYSEHCRNPYPEMAHKALGTWMG